MRREPGRIVLEFDAVEGGLVLKTGPQGSGFEIAGSDGRFVPAEAQVRGRTLVVSSASIPAPTAVRYAFTDTPTATLFNSAGLPASSFRTEAPAPEK
jgi:sialate O-acetylesterase